MNAQGEDVVAGIRTPQPIDQLKRNNPRSLQSVYDIVTILENHYRDMQDMEFTIEKGKLSCFRLEMVREQLLLHLRIAVDLVEEGMITKEEAIMRVEPKQLDQLLHPNFDPKALKDCKANCKWSSSISWSCFR